MDAKSTKLLMPGSAVVYQTASGERAVLVKRVELGSEIKLTEIDGSIWLATVDGESLQNVRQIQGSRWRPSLIVHGEHAVLRIVNCSRCVGGACSI